MARTGDDGATVRKMLDGHDEAWTVFMENNASVITRTIRMTLKKYTRHPEPGEVEDVFQDVMLRLLADGGRLLKAFDPGRASLRTWLAVIARSTALDSLRRRPAHEVKMAEDWLENVPAEEEAAPERLFPHPALSARQNQVMRLIFDHDLGVAEISKLLSVAEQTVRSLKHQAILRLRGLTPAWA